MIAIAGLGGLLMTIGFIWIVVMAAMNGDIIWAVISFFCGIAGIIYAAQHLDQGKVPLGLIGGGFVLAIIGNVLVAMQGG